LIELQDTLQVFLALAGSLAFGWLTIKRKALLPSGAFAAIGVGLWTWFHAGFMWLFPLFFFFVSSSLLGKIPKKKTEQSDQKEGKPRDWIQVACNGGIYAILASWSDEPRIQVLMLVSIAIGTADTWASEIGMRAGQTTLDLLRLKPVPRGVSGGVSLMGSLGGLLGAIAIAGFCFIPTGSLFTVTDAGLIVFSGFMGMVLDSILGASIQGRYVQSDGSLGDKPSSTLANGFRWVDNDLVNLFSNGLLTAIVYFWLL
jgi:uncharacterized protein (TIGR00297 family)